MRDSRYNATEFSGTFGTAGYQYDMFGRRIMITENGQTSYLHYSGNHVIAEVDPQGALRRSYTCGPGIDNILSMTTYTNCQTNTYYYLKDHQNSVIVLTDADGDVVELLRTELASYFWPN